MRIPEDVSGLSPYDAAQLFARHSIPTAPFDPSKGKGKSCWNLVGYQDITADPHQHRAWLRKFGEYKAIATSPGEFGCVVFDVDKPKLCPKHLRPLFAAAPYINTRPTESPNRGHYWFKVPPSLRLGNPALGFGEVRCVGGGIVLPPCGDRYIVRPGVPPVLPDELALLVEHRVVKAGAGRAMITVDQFCAKYQGNRRPHKIPALLKLHQVLLQRGQPPHNAMRETLRVGLGEAKIGYVPARQVITALRTVWDSGRTTREFDSLVAWAAQVAEDSNAQVLQLVSDRCPGTDSRKYAGHPEIPIRRQ